MDVFWGSLVRYIFWNFFNTYLLSIYLFQWCNWLQFCWCAHVMFKCWLLKLMDLKAIHFYVIICFVLQFSFFLWPWFFSKLDHHCLHNVFKTMVTKAMHKVQLSNMKQIASHLWCCKRCNIMYTLPLQKGHLQSLKVIQNLLFHKCLLKCVRHLHAR